MAFRFFWGFTHPEDPLRVGRFPKPPPLSKPFPFRLGFYPSRGPLFGWYFPQPPLAFRFSWVFSQPEDPVLVGRFSNPDWLLGSPGVLPGPRTPFCLAVRFPTPAFFTALLGFYWTRGPLLWALLIVSVLR